MRNSSVVIAFAFGLAWGMVALGIAGDWPYGGLETLKEECNYIPHPISDVAWELYDRGKVPVGTAWYYTVMMRSANKEAGDCMRDRLEPGWRNR